MRVIDSVPELVRHIPSFSLLILDNILDVSKERGASLIQEEVWGAKHGDENLWLLHQNIKHSTPIPFILNNPSINYFHHLCQANFYGKHHL